MEEQNDVKKLKQDLEDCKQKCEEYLNGWKRERADFLNYKKDETERIGQLVKYSNEESILEIIPILDNIYLAESHVPEELKENNWINGFSQIKNQLEKFLKEEGIEQIETLGKPFDPNTMEVIEEVPASAQSSDGAATVVAESQRGYTLHGKLIRPAKVKITK
jgi:molecular chaperone GrpE